MIRCAYVVNIVTICVAHRAAQVSALSMLILLLAPFANNVSAQSVDDIPSSAYECTQVSLDDVDETLLTREEKIARLDGALSDSINSYMSCVTAVQSDMSGGGAGGGSEGESASGTQSGTGQQSDESGLAETPPGAQGVPQVGSAPVPISVNNRANSARGIIAPKDNDSIICKLLYTEIQNATTSNLAGLEKQYRDYECGS